MSGVLDSDDHDRGALEGALLRRLADKIAGMLAYWDASQRCRYANRAHEQWIGAPPGGLIGRHISEILGSLYASSLPQIEGALRGEMQELDCAIRATPGGPSQHSLVSYIPDDIDGAVRGFFSLVVDISPRKRAEEALKESEAKFSGIIAISADAIISVDEELRITIFNDGAEKIFGYSKAEVLGTSLDMLLPERLRETHRQHIAAFIAGHPTARRMGERTTTVVGLRKNGEEFPAEAAISKLEVGGKLLLTVALRDITERTRVEMDKHILAEAGAVFASSLDYKQTLESIAQLIVRHLADLCIIDMIEEHASLKRLTVVHADPAMAALCERLATMPISPRHTLGWVAIETKQVQVFNDLNTEFVPPWATDPKYAQLARDLSSRSALVVPLLSGGDALGALVLVSSRPNRYGPRDVALATELARRASLALQNARLMAAERRARQARDEVLAIVAHDVRAPLSSILLAAESLEHRLAETGLAAGKRTVQTILRAVQRANRLITDLLDVARIEAGAFSVELDRIDPRQVVGDAVTSQRPLAASAGIELRIELDDELPELWADRDRLLQILENLIGNAIKFTPAHGQITLRATPQTGTVLFSVTDTGIGIPAEDLAHIFDRFWQASQAERRGAGLGLAICKGLVETHGGRVWVESTPGHGSTFSFTIPVAPPKGGHRHEASAPTA